MNVDNDTVRDPFEGLELDELYQALLTGKAGPRWPNEDLQKMYVGTNGIDLLRRSLSFVDMLHADGAFGPGWRGLDYGCGWGRFATLLLSHGSPDQLDLCDAWPKTLDILAQLGHQNRVFGVSELLEPGQIPEGAYDVILSFSVFTHLSPEAFRVNIPILLDGLRSGGRFYFTVRHAEFIQHKYADSAGAMEDHLQRDGAVFVDSGGNLGAQKVFGDMVVTPAFLDGFVADGYRIRYLGLPHTLQHVYVLEKN